MSKAILRFSEISAQDVSQVGGKAANLGKILQADLPVPDGFAICLDAFDEKGKLQEQAKPQISELLSMNKLYAVRSSALAEDSEGASWAGQFESFLDTKPENVIEKIEECHNSAKARAHAYADSQSLDKNFNIAVVVQEMIVPEYAGVLFTKDPVTGADRLVSEYVRGLGEDLVSGRADPERIAWKPGEKVKAPFAINQLEELARKVEQVFGQAQDIEWAYVNNKIWLVQARPITAVQTRTESYHLGEPEELFYWGPARTKPMYMSDWLAATELVFTQMAHDPSLPTPPKSMVLYWNGKMVMLFNQKEFNDWTSANFETYATANQFEIDFKNWQAAKANLENLNGDSLIHAITEAWTHTIFPEFSLYGTETSIAQQLERFDPATRQDIWGAFTIPDNSTFLARIDEELKHSKDPAALARKYPWIQDGYDGIADSAHEYFAKRLEIISDESSEHKEIKKDRSELVKKFKLTDDELASLTLARQLAGFMDDRKAWMMQTRRLIHKSANDIDYGWSFQNGSAIAISKEDTKELWERYVNFRSSSNAVKGIVASNGNRHFINGEVVVISSPTESVEEAGKILVVPSTSPSYIPLMRTAKALITDHGGMMSHAAIVAREFNLPCIVGTKQATKVLKSGDKVVLDLIKGEVNR